MAGRDAGGVAVERDAGTEWHGGRALVRAMFAFTVSVIALHALFDRVLTTDTGLVGLADALARPFMRPFAALMGPAGGWRTTAIAIATYSVAAVLMLRALRRAERLPTP